MRKYYYEIWFYYYGENDERTDMSKEYTFYIKTDKKINNDEELIKHLKINFPKTEKYNIAGINYIPIEDYNYLSKWFEIDGKEFTNSCGIDA